MAVNKNAQTRYRVLDKCFSNPVKKYFIQDLIEAIEKVLLEIDPDSNGIKRRQVEEDMKYMESAEGWEIPLDRLKDGKRKYFRYSDIHFSIDKQPLNQAELEQIKSAMHILSRFQGMPQFEWVHELSPKLEQAFLLEKNTETIISFDNNRYLTGIEYLGRLFHDILYKRPLSIQYQPYKLDKLTEYVIHPYYLKQYNNRWFLFGLHNDYKKITNLALDRIAGISQIEIPFIPNTICDFNEYFEDIIGVTKYEHVEVQKIILAFDKQIAPYILSKPLHESQKLVSHDEELIISIEVIPNYELESMILSFGDRVRVLAPEGFRNVIAERLKMGFDKYGW
ncbi:YafY family protein [Dyadobacter sp. NIV53]|uniref:helix-turn-helix transcriptional regulator n=1 Tax=Dyadobacter sp. NIV53 TaxID=2861765 RepID=UPI001C870944|nr:WYL domain-containing protein [Dyadobacter sp. NIV53]